MASFNTPPNLTAKQTLGNAETGTVGAGSSLAVTGTSAIDVTLATATGVVITNSGTISNSQANGRGIDTPSTVPAGVRSVTLVNNGGATITAARDVFRINADVPTGTTVSVTNAGTMNSTGTGSNNGQVIDFNAITSTGVKTTITNQATGVMTSADEDVLRPGNGGLVMNSGQIRANAVATPADQPGADGVSFDDNQTGTVQNGTGGTISGARHGITGNTGSTVTVTNAAGGSITGRDGSGVGLDGSGSVTNDGTILGTVDSGAGASARGDGDGVDVDFTATVINRGTISGAGAKGNDSGGRANTAEGISIGGGSIQNYGTIQSTSSAAGSTSTTSAAIVVNNDAMQNRSGNAATAITNFSGATISSVDGYAIRLENKGSDAISSDTILNYGTITGAGTIPDPNGTATYVNPNGGATQADPNSVGTLDGVTYTGTGSARFVRGDGSAVQMGEGTDSFTNYGTLVGATGRALNLEGGDDTLILYTGSTVSGRLDGGAGTDTLRLRLDDRAAGNAGFVGANSGVAAGTLSATTQFETLAVESGTWTVADAETYTSTLISAGASLVIGASGALDSAVTDDGSLVFHRTTDLAVGGTITGAGSVTQDGTGAVTLSGANTFSGGVLLKSGTLVVASQSGAGAGAITFGAGPETLSIEAGALDGSHAFHNTLAGFGLDGDVIDLRNIGLATGSRFDDATKVLTLLDGAGTTLASLTFAGDFTSSVFKFASDGAAGTAVTLAKAAAPFVLSDFNGDGTSDILLKGAGTLVDWTMKNGLYQSGSVLETGAEQYKLAGVGDFNGDGTSDVLVQKDGTLVDVKVSGGAFAGTTVVSTGLGGYDVKGTGDFNADGTSDIVLQNGADVVVWTMASGAYGSGTALTGSLGSGYSVVGTGDFNGDGTADILLQNGGAVVAWMMNNGQVQSTAVLTGGAAGYGVVGTGDFNGDNTTDILLQNGSTVVDWIVNGGKITATNLLTSTLAPGYAVANTGDYNGDGTDDVVLQNGGVVVDWTMSHGQVSTTHTVTGGAAGYDVF